MKIIVLASLVEDYKVVSDEGYDLGRKKKVETYLRPVALVWKLNGGPADVAKARAYAEQEGYKVFLYPVTEDDPLGRAKRDVKKTAPRRKRR